jgi:eukaryotic-like serine/threonine-protein kinase
VPPEPAVRSRGDTQTGIDLGRRLAPGTLLAGRYRVESVLGMGGMGVVYKARDQELGVVTAVKVLRPDLGQDPEWVERFRRELVLARQVTHVNVVRIHDIGESDGLRFLTMDYVEGRSLQQVLSAEGPLPLDRTLPIMRQVAEGLRHAHQAGIIHRDLKPGNVLLGNDGRAYITDFGVARSVEGGSLTRAEAMVGTPDYLAPEQIAGDTLDARTDLYALGIVFYETLTGQLPFPGGSYAETTAARLAGRTRDLRAGGVRAPYRVQTVIQRCLARSPTRRYASAADFLLDLETAPASRARSMFSPARLMVLGMVLLAGAAALFLSPWKRPAPAAATSAAEAATGPQASLAVLPLSDQTGEADLAWTSNGIADMLVGQLSEVPTLRVVDLPRVLRTLSDLSLRGDALDDGELRRLAELLEVDHVMVGVVRRAGERLRVDLRLVSFATDDEVGGQRLGAEADQAADLFRVIADLGGQVRQTLAAPAGAEPAVPDTRSLEAARAYQEGRDRLSRGESVEAAPILERAVAADPGMAAALERLSEAYQNLGYQDKALAAAENAAHAVRPSQRLLALRIQARLALLKGDPAAAEKAFRERARLFPQDTEALLDLATAQSSRGDVAETVQTLRQAAERDRSDPRIWFLLGKNTIIVGEARKALSDYLVRALALQTQLRNEQGQGDVLNAMGVAHHQLGDYREALEKYSAAAEIRKKLGDWRGYAVSLKNRARVNRALGQLDEVSPDLEQARGLFQKIGDQGGLADVMNDFGALAEARGDYAGALGAYQEALRLRHTLGDERQTAQSYDNVGYISFQQGQYDNALVYWQQALDRRRRLGEKRGVILSTQNMGFLQIAQGRWAEAMKSFLEALEASRQMDFKNAVAVSYGNIGLLQQYEGRYADGLSSLDQALAVLKELQDKQGLAEFTLKEAEALLEMGALEAGRAKLDAAEPWIRETANHERTAGYLLARAEWQQASGDVKTARQTLQAAIVQATASRSRAMLLRARLAQAVVQAAADPRAGAPSLRAVAKDADRLGEALLRMRSGEALGRAELQAGHAKAAEEAARRALEIAEKSGWEAGRFRLLELLASIAEKRGDRPTADRFFAESARSIERLRGHLPGELRTLFDALGPVRRVTAWTKSRGPLAARAPASGDAP